jgi:large subunit ribosomal protein L7/L12
MSLEDKIVKVKKVEEGLKRSEASFVVDYQGLKVTELTELRKLLRSKGARFLVVKNTLASRAVGGAGLEGVGKFFYGCTGIVFVEHDPLASAKILKDFVLDHPQLTFKGGILGGEILEGDKIKVLGGLPSREILLVQLLTLMQFPLRRLLGVLSSPMGNLIFLLTSILEKKGGSSMVKTPPVVKKKDEKSDKPKVKVDKKEEVIKAVEGMNVLELSELIKGLEDRFGVEAAAPQVISQVAPLGEKKEEEKTEFDVVLSEIGSKKIQVIKEVRKLTTLGLKEAKDLVEQAPKPVKQGVSKEEAQKIKEILEAVGAKVELK